MPELITEIIEYLLDCSAAAHIGTYCLLTKLVWNDFSINHLFSFIDAVSRTQVKYADMRYVDKC